MESMFRICRLYLSRLCSIIAMTALFCSPAYCESAGQDFEDNMMKQYDWVMTCDLEELPNYLKYKDSIMNPMSRYKIGFQFSQARMKMLHMSNVNCEPQKYEELWYHSGKALGLKRFRELQSPKNLQGVIYFRSNASNGVATQTAATANCAVRLLLDLYLKRGNLVAVIVPNQCFEQVSSDLGRSGFAPLSSAFDDKGENMSLLLLSYPRGNARSFYCDDTRTH